ncbi:MAG: tRNA(Ile)-lysidine synthetase [Mailhella sp.]|nr:tRNA(Ile)-lysidine synthetase [Mailhella sp.]
MHALPADVRPELAALETALSGIELGGTGNERGNFALAYSGGMDSRFLAHAARLLGFEPHLLMAVGPQVPPEEEEYGESWALRNGLSFRKIEVDTLSLPLVAVNGKRRCYECKREIFSRLREAASLPLCDGTNASDALAYRPGTQAVRELGVHSPLTLAGLAKSDIYRLAALTGLERPGQKPRPCLLTRLPYGMKADAETLHALASGERAVRLALEAAGLPEADFRLRIIPSGEGMRTELHLLKDEDCRVPPELKARLPGIIGEAAPRLPSPAHISEQDSLSGFFDKVQLTDTI